MTAGPRVVEVRVGGQRVARGSLTTVPRAPGLFAVLNQDGRPNSASNPAGRNQVLQIFATGQGEVRPAAEDGAASPPSPLSVTAEPPGVFVGGRRAPVQFSGLAPGFVGVWQINAVIPAGAPVGPAVSLVVLDGLLSNSLSIAVQ